MVKVKSKVPTVAGVKYGQKSREKVGRVVDQYKPKNMTCPFTGKKGKVRRLASGIYVSTATGEKFTGRAYSPN